ncbi:MAG: hypothetical protein AAF726_17945 [Planctomycetota bacterium]
MTLRSLLALASALALATPALAQVYSYDDGSTENALNFTGAAEVGFLHGFDAAGGADSIAELHVAIGTALAPAGQLDGDLLRLAVWDDPSNDGDPSDAVLLFESAPLAATQTNSDLKVTYPLTPAVPVTGTFFVGIAVEANAGEFPVGLDISAGGSGAPAYVISSNSSIDLGNLNGNTVPPTLQTNAVFLLDAVGGGASSFGTLYCSPAVANSSGAPATISGSGSLAAADNNLLLEVQAMPTNTFGYFIASRIQGFVPGPGGSQGNLCIGGTIGRFLQQVQNSGPGGSIAIQVDLTAIPQATGTVAAVAGDTWNFQAWFRDANPSITSNFSDALSITFN